MNSRKARRAMAVLAGLLVTLPFALLELVTRNPELPRSNFPIPLFAVMWLFAGVFFYLAHSTVRAAREGRAKEHVFAFSLQVGVAALIAWNWTYLVVDQMPCFLGATGC